MKTTGLNFLEAVQALRSKKCEGIRREGWARGFHMLLTDGGFLEWSDSNRCLQAASALENDWHLVNPIVPTEEREVTGWMGIRKSDGKVMGVYAEQPETWTTEWELVELTGTYRVPVKEREKKQVVIEGAEWKLSGAQVVPTHGKFSNDLGYYQFHGKTGTLTFEWEE